MGDGEKICVLCGQSCAGQARIKNEKGQYAHQSCVKAEKEGRRVEPVAHDEGSDDALGGGMDDLIDDIGEENMLGGAEACPGCGHRMGDGAIVCMSCGYNAQSGRQVSTKSKEAKPSGTGGAALGGVAKIGGFAASPLVPFVGALVGGAIGAAIWAAIAYFLNVEIVWIAIGVGVLTGLGATVGSVDSSGGGVITGAMAAIVAMGAITAGKYIATYMTVQDYFADELFEQLVLEDIDDERMHASLAYDICLELIDQGEPIAWEDPKIFVFSASWPEDYPLDIESETLDRWESMSWTEKRDYRKMLSDEYGSEVSMADIDTRWALSELVNDICLERMLAGESIEWMDQSLPLRIASWPDDYPQEIQDLTLARWDSMSAEDRDLYQMDVLDRVNLQRSATGEFGQALTKESFIQSFMHPFDLIFMFLAVITAYGIAANEG